MNNHPVITADYPSNQTGGVMICGINFGYSVADEELEQQEFKIKKYLHISPIHPLTTPNFATEYLSGWNLGGLICQALTHRDSRKDFFKQIG